MTELGIVYLFLFQPSLLNQWFRVAPATATGISLARYRELFVQRLSFQHRV